jgi:cytochrome c oxidase subunit III
MRAPHLYEQYQDLDQQAHAARLGMWAFLGSEVLLFAVLFALYAAYRTMYSADFEAAIAHNNLLIGTVNTIILITSSLTVVLALAQVEKDRPLRAGALLAISVCFGLVFLILKGIEYAQHLHEGIYPGAAYHFAEMPGYGARLFFTLYYLMTGLHALHVIVGMLLLGWIMMGTFTRQYSAPRSIQVELGALYWHLIDIMWIFLWPMLYLMHR